MCGLKELSFDFLPKINCTLNVQLHFKDVP